jgi:hypothetical protein
MPSYANLMPRQEHGNLGGQPAMAETKDLTVEMDASLIKRLKVYAALLGQPVKVVVAKWLDEKLPPLPRESEATA